MDREDPGMERERVRERERVERERERERERDNIYIYFCTCINPSYFCRENILCLLVLGVYYSSQWYRSVA